MIAVHRAEDFENLPDEGFWEAANGEAILLPYYEFDHQRLSVEFSERIHNELERLGRGRLIWTVNVDIPPICGEGFRTRVPDLVIYEHRPSGKRFHWQDPPVIAVEIDRTDKLHDYARAGIMECWVVDRGERMVEIYRLNGDRYDPAETVVEQIQSTAMPGLRIDLRGIFDTI